MACRKRLTRRTCSVRVAYRPSCFCIEVIDLPAFPTGARVAALLLPAFRIEFSFLRLYLLDASSPRGCHAPSSALLSEHIPCFLPGSHIDDLSRVSCLRFRLHYPWITYTELLAPSQRLDPSASVRRCSSSERVLQRHQTCKRVSQQRTSAKRHPRCQTASGDRSRPLPLPTCPLPLSTCITCVTS